MRERAILLSSEAVPLVSTVLAGQVLEVAATLEELTRAHERAGADEYRRLAVGGDDPSLHEHARAEAFVHAVSARILREIADGLTAVAETKGESP